MILGFIHGTLGYFRQSHHIFGHRKFPFFQNILLRYRAPCTKMCLSVIFIYGCFANFRFLCLFPIIVCISLRLYYESNLI